MAMKAQIIQSRLGTLWSNVITNFEFDLAKQRLQINTEISSETMTTQNELIFEQVSSLYFVNGYEHQRFDFDPWDHAELTSIAYFPKPLDHIHRTNTESRRRGIGVLQYHSLANFVIEIWSTMLFVEAGAIKINDLYFDVSTDLQTA